MSDRLLELAERAGVKTTWTAIIPTRTVGGEYQNVSVERPRPRLDIAHDLLARLPCCEAVIKIWPGKPECLVQGPDWGVMCMTFEECVVGLAERAQEDKP